MKRLLVLFIVLVTVLSLFALPISADEVNTPNSEQNIEETEENKNFFEKIIDFLKGIEVSVGSFGSFFNWSLISIDYDAVMLTLRNGGFNHVSENTDLNLIISTVYKIIYPIGFIVMLLCWGFGIAKSTVSASLDIKDRNSIIHSVISLIIGVAAMSLAPQILTLLTGISQWLCNSIYKQGVFSSIIRDIQHIEIVSIQSAINDTSHVALFNIIVILVVDLIFMINLLWLALLQCLSPIFMGLMANTNTRKFGFNFIKEYFKALLVPAVTLIYFFLASTLAGGSHVTGLIVSLVLAISTLGIAGKKLDKLIN